MTSEKEIKIKENENKIDYVFNPVENTHKIQVGDPVDVLEIGTGSVSYTHLTLPTNREV